MQIMDKYVQAGEALAWKENEVLDLTKQVCTCFQLGYANGTRYITRVTFPVPLGKGSTSLFCTMVFYVVVC